MAQSGYQLQVATEVPASVRTRKHGKSMTAIEDFMASDMEVAKVTTGSAQAVSVTLNLRRAIKSMKLENKVKVFQRGTDIYISKL